MSVYDPALGGINCDDDCTTIATGKLEPEMYEVVAACHPLLLTARVNVPGVGTFHCLDTGTAIIVRWNSYYQRRVLWFDVLYNLVDQPPPDWAYWAIEDWTITWAD
jgi:hypothetical protein